MLVSNIFLIFADKFCISCRDSDNRQKTNLIRMMKETNIQPQVMSTIAGDDGEAVGKVKKTPQDELFYSYCDDGEFEKEPEY